MRARSMHQSLRSGCEDVLTVLLISSCRGGETAICGSSSSTTGSQPFPTKAAT